MWKKIRRALQRVHGRSTGASEEAIRAELFSIERLEQHAESLAVAQGVTTKRTVNRRLPRRLRDNGRVLLEAYRAIAAAIREERSITPAAEWLVDNFHVVEEQIREIRDDLPRGYYHQLPKLSEGPLAGYPRVFGVAWAFVAHTDSRFDPQVLCRFIQAYQRVEPLTIGELWAIAITLRIVLVENVRRSAEGIVTRRAARQEADALADRLLGVGGREPETLERVLRGLDQRPLPAAFAVQLVQRLRDQDPTVTPALLWLEQRLAAQGTTADEVVHEEHQRQGAMNVTVRNAITSMRLMSAVDWSELFESVSLVDAVLRADSSFAEMDFATRDRYRHAIEELARGSAHTELDIAKTAIVAAKRAAAESSHDDASARREQEPGYYLIANGRRALEAEIGFRLRPRQWLLRAYTTTGILGYLGTIAIVTALLSALSLVALAKTGTGEWTLVVFAFLALIPALDVSVAVVNRGVTNRFGPQVLPGLELRDGVPSALRTLIVVPTLLTTPAELEEQIERLEVHHLATPDGDLCFALLSDWTDSTTEYAPGDDKLLEAAVAGIRRLNRLYGPAPDGDRFLLLHRRRIWNEGEGKWLGWERKRGKLHELNRLLRGATDTTFVTNGACAAVVPDNVRYVITLDADTRLPRGAAKRLVGKMAHPLNHPTLDPCSGRVIEGYAVLQPRVTPSLPTGREGSLFQRVFSSPSGIDPYAAAVSDVYQDLFGEGSYTGKGIYDVDAFEAALEGRIPDSTLLSHDLLEGIFARAGLVSDIEVVEEFPARYDVAAARQHRWARGDWQLLPWIIGRGPNTPDASTKTAIPLIGRWKMIDNLRRTMSAPATFLGLLAGWTLPVSAAAIWSLFILVTIAAPGFLPLFAGLVPRRFGISKRSHLRAVALDLTAAFLQVMFLVTLLAHQAWLMTDAVIRTLFRLFIRRRSLLEWVTAAQAKLRARLDVRESYSRMSGGVVLALLAVGIIACFGRDSWLIASPFVILWLSAPAVARWSSFPPPLVGPNPPSAEQAQALRLIARRTWSFFEAFVTAEDHVLPPDNFQEDPNPVVAHRTSPTNLGLYLLSAVTAHDFGWLGSFDTVKRLGETLTTMGGLERFRGHFYNWYDTQRLSPLDPKYVSSVDSGNLAGHLIALGNAMRDMADGPAISAEWRSGIDDALKIACQGLRQLADDRRTQTVTTKHLETALEALTASILIARVTPAEVVQQLAELALEAQTAADIARTLHEERGDDGSAEVSHWVEAVRASILSHQHDVDELMPWAKLAGSVTAGAGEKPDDGEPAGEPMFRAMFEGIPTITDLPQHCDTVIAALTRRRSELIGRAPDDVKDGARIDALIDAFERSASAAGALQRRLIQLKKIAGELVAAMEFAFLFEPTRQLLAIGYRVAEGSLDPNCYDLLASEARLASFVAIAKGDVPARHWFRLRRDLTPVDRGSALISWSGSMFEYLMPSLVMRASEESLLSQSNRLVVRRQIKYGAKLGVPWGVSESAYNARDLELTYQYSNFGVPGLGLKRGLSENVVIAPYATGLATMVNAEAAARNFSRIAAAGGCGRYGCYEALDYTPTRLPEGKQVAIVRAYMAHHQGMTLVAINDALRDGVMRARFHAEPSIQATELLLQERTPRDVLIARPRAEEVATAANIREIVAPMLRRFRSPHDAIPRTHMLSNGGYAVMITAAGSGYSRWRDLAVTRWREDVTCDSWGTYVFLRDVRSGEVWSAGYQPSRVEPDSYAVVFSEDRAEITRRDGTITTTLEVAVSPEDDAEVRRVTISNLGSSYREIELTSYAEVVLAPPAADAAHPAFAKLFVQTELVADIGAVIATRRPRSPDESVAWAAHLAVVEGETVGDLQFETDRAAFLGRAREIRTPISVIDGRPLSNTVGTVLDPIFSLRRRLRIPPGGRARVAFWTLIAPSRDGVLDLADKHRDPIAFDRALTLAWTQAQVQLHHLGVGPEEAHLFQRVANHVIYANSTMRPSSEVLKRGESGASTLWAHGISGDLPIVLVRIDEIEDREIVRQLVRAHEYWRIKQLDADLVVLNERSASYDQDLQGSLEALVRANQARTRAEGDTTHGSVFVLRSDLISADVRNLLQTAARLVIWSSHGSLLEQVNRLEESLSVSSAPSQRRSALTSPPPAQVTPQHLEFFNGFGGFDADGREYVTILREGQWTPAPWVNVIANSSFGFQVSAVGSSYTWSVNSRENQLTPWSNDPVSDRPGEVIYVRDEDTGEVWGPTALPIREEAPYVARHGQGYSRFEHSSHEVSLELLQYVSPVDPIKISRLKIRNLSARSRRLSITSYVEWVLGASRGSSALSVVTEIDSVTGAMLARNPWNNEFGGRVAFADMAGRQSAWTGDRREFLGRHGTLDRPAALEQATPLSNRVGAGLDSCCAQQTQVRLLPNGETEIVFFLGQAQTKTQAVSLISHYRSTDLDAVFGAITRQWDDVLGAVQIKTPDRSMDILINRWLLYQTLGCRVWARSAFYQASGAYGFRDQLQDVMALTMAQPGIAREHLLRAAERQFLEGDVQHWWLPSSGRGVRTHNADDRAWLPYATAHYVEVTGDLTVLDSMVPFLEGPGLETGENEAFSQPKISGVDATLFEHCAKALDASLAVGEHGLPLIGTGDWNDGMNRVGAKGGGESIWLGWFLYSTLCAFSKLADNRGDRNRAANWRRHAVALKESLERHGWDGRWYRRAYYDDGTPLGSVLDTECRIDSVAQSWGVISGGAEPERATSAMAALDEYLVRRNEGLVLLFTPPFDKTAVDPGYIKGYPPGLRENGGQYTHAAIWSLIAFAMLGDGDRAGELFAMLNPINHANTRAAIHRYKVEPYVMSADIYSTAPHIGRGGWTWYTGSAGWMYRAGVEWILGLRLRGATLLIDPCIPKAWLGFEIVFLYRSARYEIAVDNPRGVSRGVSRLALDDKVWPQGESGIPLVDDGATHRVRVTLG
ncbi:MAG TPA: glucoamylase family protein [Candidatus Binataceae bacterium]|nr:glucoamylase family protein [Candidatus Binataceae bacterium]